MPLSSIDCVQPAIQHAREQLLSPFRWGQWSRLALVGILAAEIHVGGCNFGNIGRFTSPRRSSGTEFLPPGVPHIDPARLGQYLGLIAVIVLLAAILFFVFLYISSVFRFILFESVLKKTCSISDGWQRWQRAGGRFFLWQLVFQIAAGMFFAVFIGVPVAMAAAAGWLKGPKEHVGGMVGALILLVGVVLIFALAAAAVQMLAKDFLVPLMALEGLDFADGWSRLIAMIRPEPGKYAVYLLLKLALSIAAAILFGIAAILPVLALTIPAVVIVFMGKAGGLGWNVATISLAIIFGTLLLLVLIYLIAWISVPATVFFPAYSIYFFASRYPALDALLHPPAPAAVELPPTPEVPSPAEPPPLPPAPNPIG